MTLSLTCACGVHLEVDETFAGQTINCPDCQRQLRVPAANRVPRRTSGLAIASLVLALVGAFTVVAPLVAALLGGIALAAIKGQRDRLAGKGFAVAGVVCGLVFAGLGLFAYSSVELFGLDSLLRQPQWAGKLDFDGPLEVVRPSDGFAITRPSREWGVFQANRQEHELFLGALVHQPLLLVKARESAYIACLPLPAQDGWTLEDCRRKAMDELGRVDLASGDARRRLPFPAHVEVKSTRTLPDRGETESVEMEVVKQARRQEKKFLVRVVRKKQDDLMYVVVGGARTGSYQRVEAEVRQALDSFRVIDRDRPPEWQNQPGP
jgi:hypothetical protein